MLDVIKWPTSQFEVVLGGQIWTLERIVDLETLWDAMEDNDDDKHIPYWVELWPASLRLGGWLMTHKKEIRGKTCLDLGCGLGLTAIIAMSLGARVTAIDFEWAALFFAKKNAHTNNIKSPFWLQMDWCRHGFKPNVFDYIWGGDILYEQRFFSPISSMFASVLAPGGRIVLSTPERTVSRTVWGQFVRLGWKVKQLADTQAALQSMEMPIKLVQLTR